MSDVSNIISKHTELLWHNADLLERAEQELLEASKSLLEYDAAKELFEQGERLQQQAVAEAPETPPTLEDYETAFADLAAKHPEWHERIERSLSMVRAGFKAIEANAAAADPITAEAL